MPGTTETLNSLNELVISTHLGKDGDVWINLRTFEPRKMWYSITRADVSISISREDATELRNSLTRTLEVK